MNLGKQLSANKMDKTHIWEIIAHNLGKAGWSWGCVATVDSPGQTICIVEAHRGDGKRFVVRADEKFTAFLELESAIRSDSLPRRKRKKQHLYRDKHEQNRIKRTPQRLHPTKLRQ